VDKPGFITPPPNLIPPRHDTGTQTQRAPSRKRELPVFLPATAGAPAAETVQHAQWRLTLPDGSTVAVTGTLLLGRDPVLFDPWSNATLVKLDDPAKSVSKTHAAIDVTDAGLTVTDLHSTNGVFVVPSGGDEIAVKPGGSTDVGAGASVELGRYTILVDQS
jgi:FHA domain-containing protein